MAYDAYMKAKDVEGEATAKGMEGQIEVLSFSFGASNPSTVGPGTGGIAAGRVSVSSFNIMKRTDKASPVLFQSCCKGKHIGEIVVTLRKASGDSGQAPFLKYTFTDCMIESIQWSGASGSGDDQPTESVSIAFAKVNVEYQQQSTAGGAVGQPVVAEWDLTAVAGT
jgi:type VI secretion system secreted protein Hcp